MDLAIQNRIRLCNTKYIGIVQKCVPGDNLAERISMLK